jgi:hypothetical protein
LTLKRQRRAFHIAAAKPVSAPFKKLDTFAVRDLHPLERAAFAIVR